MKFIGNRHPYSKALRGTFSRKSGPDEGNLNAPGTTFQKKVPLKVLEEGCPFQMNFTKECHQVSPSAIAR
ncbi:MAG: hypothetical protein ACI3ZN_00170, partial [Candidatus Cryptobacteroides sp.]